MPQLKKYLTLTYLFAFLCCVFLACTSQAETERQAQIQRLAKAKTTLAQEQAYLQTLRDSLPIKVQQNIKLGIPPKQAESVEQALITMQETVVNVAKHNLKVQTAFLDSLKKYQP